LHLKIAELVEFHHQLPYAHMVLGAERAWAYAMQLKQESNTEPRKRFHLVNKLRRACFYALQLQELCNVSCNSLL